MSTPSITTPGDPIAGPFEMVDVESFLPPEYFATLPKKMVFLEGKMTYGAAQTACAVSKQEISTTLVRILFIHCPPLYTYIHFLEHLSRWTHCGAP